MTVRASRVLPGMLVTVLLAAPAFATLAFAAPAFATTPSDRSEQVRHHRTATHKPATAAAATPAAATSVRPRTLRPHLVAAARPRKPAAGSAQPGLPPEPQSAAFIDDNFAYGDPAQGQPAWKQSGVASWYGGPRWQGHATFSGARYNENDLTAAHATLPMGSKVKVQLHHSDRAVVVTINDRPGTRSRIIDLSRGAAAKLGILAQGVAMVTLSPAP